MLPELIYQVFRKSNWLVECLFEWAFFWKRIPLNNRIVSFQLFRKQHFDCSIMSFLSTPISYFHNICRESLRFFSCKLVNIMNSIRKTPLNETSNRLYISFLRLFL